VTILCVWLGLSYSRAKRQERAVAAIESLGGEVGYDWQYDGGDSSQSNPRPRGPMWLRSFLGPHYFDTVVSVRIARTGIPPKSLHFTEFAKYLENLPGLKRLSTFQLELSEAEFPMLARLQTLEVLTLGKTELTESGGRQIARLSNLRELSLHDDIVSAGALASLRDMPLLEDLSVYCRHEDKRSDGLPIWDLEKYAIRDDALVSLPSLKRLKTLSLTFTQITDSGVAILGEMPQLEVLGLSSPQITNTSMDHVTKLKNLRWLGVSACKMDIAGVARLAELPKLTGLRISGPAIGNNSLPVIATLGQLQKLDLGGKTIDDNGLPHLYGMKNLMYLDLQSTAVETDGRAVLALKKALPKCQIHQYYPNPSFR
jgi:hypothetical protein